MSDFLNDSYDPAALDQENAAEFREEMRAERQAARESVAQQSDAPPTGSTTGSTGSPAKHRLDKRAVAAGALGGPLGWIILATWKTLGWIHHKE